MNNTDIRQWIVEFLDTIQFSSEFNPDLDRTQYPRVVYNEFSLQHELGLYLRDRIDELNKTDSTYANYVVEFERNRSFFGIRSEYDFLPSKKNVKLPNILQTDGKLYRDIVKSEIDIVIYDSKDINADKYAIELKFPLNGEYPEQMFKFIEDIRFLEQLVYAPNCVNDKNNVIENQKLFTHCFAVTLVNDHTFRIDKGNNKKKIYDYFRTSLQNDTPIPIRREIKDSIDHKDKKGNLLPKKTLYLEKTYNIKWKLCHENDSTKPKEELNKALHYYIVDVPGK